MRGAAGHPARSAPLSVSHPQTGPAVLQSHGRHTAVTAGGYFYNVSVTHACIYFSTESHLRPEMALHSVQPLLGYERTVVEGNFL